MQATCAESDDLSFTTHSSFVGGFHCRLDVIKIAIRFKEHLFIAIVNKIYTTKSTYLPLRLSSFKHAFCLGLLR